jgi:hypothetical protein
MGKRPRNGSREGSSSSSGGAEKAQGENGGTARGNTRGQQLEQEGGRCGECLSTCECMGSDSPSLGGSLCLFDSPLRIRIGRRIGASGTPHYSVLNRTQQHTRFLSPLSLPVAVAPIVVAALYSIPLLFFELAPSLVAMGPVGSPLAVARGGA